MGKQLNNKNYIAIADWMIKDLGLSSRELLVYAIIYGFSQDGESWFTGSLDYLASWLNITDRSNVLRTLNSLVKKNLIIKEKLKLNDKQQSCCYKVTDSKGDAKTYEHIFISPWMINSLDLTDKELILYALIYGFSRVGSSSYCQASTEYFGDWLGVQKNHVKERYLNKMVKKGVLVAVDSQRENTRYKAVVPDEIEKQSNSHFDNTSPKYVGNDQNSQIDNTLSHFDNTSCPKMTTNNLDNNLVDNLDIIDNNNNTNLTTVKDPSKEELSVVVNEHVPVDNFTIDQEKEVFEQKKRRDFELYSKFKKKNPLIQFIMKGFAKYCFRVMLARWPGISIVDKAQELLLDTVCCPRFKGRQRDIIGLGEKKISELFHIALDLNDPESDLTISKSKKAYLIGVIETMLEEK